MESTELTEVTDSTRRNGANEDARRELDTRGSLRRLTPRGARWVGSQERTRKHAVQFERVLASPLLRTDPDAGLRPRV